MSEFGWRRESDEEPTQNVVKCGLVLRVARETYHAVRLLQGRTSWQRSSGHEDGGRPRIGKDFQIGQTLIEFALVAPLVLFFLLAIVDFGIAIDRRLVLDHAVHEGARFAAVGGDALVTGVSATVDDIKVYTAQHSQGVADAAGTVGDDSYIDVCYENENGNGRLGDEGDRVEVRVHYRHDFVTGFTGLIQSSLASIDLNPRASARVERTVEPPPMETCTGWPP